METNVNYQSIKTIIMNEYPVFAKFQIASYAFEYQM